MSAREIRLPRGSGAPTRVRYARVSGPLVSSVVGCWSKQAPRPDIFAAELVATLLGGLSPFTDRRSRPLTPASTMRRPTATVIGPRRVGASCRASTPASDHRGRRPAESAG